jgi:hypothetical protein
VAEEVVGEEAERIVADVSSHLPAVRRVISGELWGAVLYRRQSTVATRCKALNVIWLDKHVQRPEISSLIDGLCSTTPI